MEWAFTGDTEVCGRELGQFGRSRPPLAISLLWHTSSLDDTCNNAVSPLHKPNTTGSDNVVAYAVLAARDVSSAQRSVGTGSSQTRSSRVRPSSELQGESFRDPDITAWRGEKKENKRKERWSKVLFLVASCVSACQQLHKQLSHQTEILVYHPVHLGHYSLPNPLIPLSPLLQNPFTTCIHAYMHTLISLIKMQNPSHPCRIH